MITNTGKSIIGKYLLGNAPAYASYIALGSGAKPGTFASEDLRTLDNCYSEYWLVPGSTPDVDYDPRKFFIINPTNDLSSSVIGSVLAMNPVAVDSNDVFDNNGRFSQSIATTVVDFSNDDFPKNGDPNLHYKSITVSTDLEEYLYQGNVVIKSNLEKQTMDFEMFRVPISSRGYITENGVNKIVLTSELPTEERYEISEIGVYSAGANDEAGAYDSKVIFSFSEQEDWQLSAGATTTSPTATSITFPIILDKLTTNDDAFNETASNAFAIKTNSNNTAFYTTAREARYERPRFLNNTYLLNGSNSHILNSKTYSATLLDTVNAVATLSSGGLYGTNTFICNVNTGNILVGQSVTVTGGSGSFAANTYVTAVSNVGGVATVTLSANIDIELGALSQITFKSSKIYGSFSTVGLNAGMELRKIGGTGIFGGTCLITKLNEEAIISTTGTVGTVSGSGPFTATISGMSSTVGLTPGLLIKATAGTGNFGSGLMTVVSVSTNSITVSSTLTFTAGTVTNIAVISQITVQTPSDSTAGTIVFLVMDAILSVQTTATGLTEISNKYLILNTQRVDLSRNSSSDLLKLAFTVINRDTDSGDPDNIRVAVKFSNYDGSQFATFGAEALGQDYDYAGNRYVVITKNLSELEYSSTFSWNSMTKAEIFTSAIRNIAITNKQRSTNKVTLTSTGHELYAGDIVTVRGMGAPLDGTFVVSEVTLTTFSYLTTTSGTIASTAATGYAEASTKDFWIALDAFRLENVSTNNPLYGLIGYSVVNGTSTLVKNANSTNYIEFRFALDVL